MCLSNVQVVPDRAPPGGVWKVTPRWIIDSEKYNEWMNPADYTTPEQDAEMDAAEAADAKVRPAISVQAYRMLALSMLACCCDTPFIYPCCF